MDYTVEQVMQLVDKPFLYVDYNELLDDNVIMLSQHDTKKDFHGTPVPLSEGLAVIGYQQDEEKDGSRDDIICEGVCIRNTTDVFPHVKWLLQINSKGIRYSSDILKEGW